MLVCEGKNTEPQYFEELRSIYSDALISIDIQEAAGVPETIARTAANLANEMKVETKNSFEEHDEVWAVFDRDTHPNYERALDICRRSGVRIARSNPCFELWLILHFKDYDKPGNAKAAQRHLETLCSQYKKSKGKRVNCEPLLPKIEEAERRASAQLRNRESEGAAFGPPSTTVGELTASLRQACDRARRR